MGLEVNTTKPINFLIFFFKKLINDNCEKWFFSFVYNDL